MIVTTILIRPISLSLCPLPTQCHPTTTLHFGVCFSAASSTKLTDIYPLEDIMRTNYLVLTLSWKFMDFCFHLLIASLLYFPRHGRHHCRLNLEHMPEIEPESSVSDRGYFIHSTIINSLNTIRVSTEN